jgi:REP element-mobilizing transposase RayT
VELDVLTIMPNHVHGILRVLGKGEAFSGQKQTAQVTFRENASPLRPASGTQGGSLAAIIQNFKSISTRKINRIRSTSGAPLWQRDYYEHIIRDEDELARIRTYIVNNPLQWELDRENPAVTVRKKPTEPWQV